MKCKKNKKVAIKSYYKKSGDDVYLLRQVGENDWEAIKTPYKEIPVTKLKFLKHL